MFNAFGNATQVSPQNWRDEPATRGTWSILSTCLITLGLCLWTALHLNIPRHKDGVWRQMMRKTLWLLLGLLAPEMLAYTAWYQHQAAHKLNTVMQRKLGQRVGRTRAQRLAAFFTSCCCRYRKQGVGHKARDVELDERERTDVERDASSNCISGRRHRWTTAHSFYFLMGGFVFDTSDEDVNFLPNNRQRLTLTPTGLMYILKHEPDLVPNISKEHIYDKSKASNLAKTIVCLQALWFCTQCIVRLAQGLAVSLLELNVFGHAICALLMYILWWDKPLDIEEPTVLSGNMVREMCALMCMRSSTLASPVCQYTELPFGIKYGNGHMRNIAEISARPDKKYSKIKRYLLHTYAWTLSTRVGDRHEILVDWLGPGGFIECQLDWNATGSVNQQRERFNRDSAYPVNLDYALNEHTKRIQSLPPDPSIYTNRIDIDGFYLTLGMWAGSPLGFTSRLPQPDYAPVSVHLSDADVLRWRLCARALQSYTSDNLTIDAEAYQSVSDRSPNWPSSLDVAFTKEGGDHGRTIWLGFSFAGLVYGGLHLLAWDAPFPSPSENQIWRGSGVLLTSSGFFYTLWGCAFVSSMLVFDWVEGLSLWQSLFKSRLGLWFKLIRFIVALAYVCVILVPMLCFVLSYVAARGYIVVESFLQLEHLPDSAYALPSWSQYFPHIM